MSEAPPPTPSPSQALADAPRPGGHALPVFLATFVLAVAGIWGYIELGGGAAGAPGLAVVLAPFAAVVAACFVSALRRRVRAHRTATTLGILIPFVLCSFGLPELARRERFDSATWKREAGGKAKDWRRPHRVRQIDHLLDSGLLDGKSRAEVMELLGPDDSARGTGFRRGSWPGTDAVYFLGPMRGLVPMDDEWLLIDFDATGKVAKYRWALD